MIETSPFSIPFVWSRSGVFSPSTQEERESSTLGMDFRCMYGRLNPLLQNDSIRVVDVLVLPSAGHGFLQVVA